MALIHHTFCVAFLFFSLTTVWVEAEMQHLVLNKIYNGTIHSPVVNSYYFTRQAGQTVRIQTMINSTELDIYLPLLISVEQKRSILSWTLPEDLTKFSDISFAHVSRTLCSDYANQSSNITIWALTSSMQTINYTLEVNLVSNFHLSPSKGMDSTSVNISGGSPYYFLVSFPENSSSDVMRISLNSEDDSCVMASLQPAVCPVDDLLSTVEYRGVYLTFQKSADIIFDRNGIGSQTGSDSERYLVLVSAPSNKCNSSASANYYQMDLLLDSKKIDIKVAFQLAKWEYWRPVVILLVLLLLPFFILIPLFLIETLLVLKFKFLERHYPLIFYTPTLDHIMRPEQIDPVDLDTSLETTLLVQATLSTSIRGIEGMTMKEMKSRYNIENFKLHDLTRKEDRYLSKKYFLYLTSVITITIFYALPALQVAIYRAILYSAGDNDLCYFNFKCAHTLGHVISFNNIWSNIAYLILGMLFIVLTAIKHILRNIKYRDRERYHDYRKRGITPYYGIYYAMGLALISEGLMSSIYHTCPSGINFQFDTTFMFVISLLSILKLYQNRHPDISVSASTAFILIGSLIILTAFGLLADKPEYLLVRTIYALIVIGITFFICLNIYFFSHPLLFFISFYETLKSRSMSIYLLSLKNWGFPPVNRARIVHITIVCLTNLLSLFCLYFFRMDAATALLLFIILNQLFYMAYYWFMKLINKELCNRPFVALFSIFLTLASGVFFLLALVFFFNSVTNWQFSPSGSRFINEECVFLGFFDSHDIWHVLSAFGLFFNFLAITTIDDNISEIPKNKIHVF